MITKEVREWIQKVERGAYKKEDAMQEFSRFSRYLTREEMQMIQTRLKSFL